MAAAVYCVLYSDLASRRMLVRVWVSAISLPACRARPCASPRRKEFRATLLYQLTTAADVAGQHWKAARQSLSDGHQKSLAPGGRHHQEGGLLHRLEEPFVILEAGPLQAGCGLGGTGSIACYLRGADPVHVLTGLEAGFTEIRSNDRRLLASTPYLRWQGRSVS